MPEEPKTPLLNLDWVRKLLPDDFLIYILESLTEEERAVLMIYSEKLQQIAVINRCDHDHGISRDVSKKRLENGLKKVIEAAIAYKGPEATNKNSVEQNEQSHSHDTQRNGDLENRIRILEKKMRLLAKDQKKERETEPEPISKLKITSKQIATLKHAGIQTIDDLTKKSEQELLELNFFGKVLVKKIREELKKMGLSLVN